ncbi:late embryogenesis abundant protein Lea14-A-like [Diospyros lotus]|uniref:late embryogenesis abundant protein Lea14-A-like n=1 Tax=Diospyros lotus TaxID=55363 RepID=UPI00225BC49C|nr:late embryogenesis abundant protein Lea14-A-like [Diospyros lotus]
MANLVEKAKSFVADIKKPEATVMDVDLKDVGSDAVTYNAEVSIANPYSHPIPICQISYSLRSSGREIASGTVPDPGSLTGNETTKVNVPVKVPHSVLVSLVKDIGADWDIDYELRLGLTVDLPVVGDFTIPLSTAGEIKLPSLSGLWNKQ